ncbi:hypothetical protein [Anaeromyxobacter sp. SG66]|uniref:hypothetical protein n=1 Tax=Anaeromyxobacter sp. SG66 TaxID=2925410 RepID=UPI001F578163|nr:hypothetical protein [Anaeromyxobacter sp. SG66]
MSSPNVVAFPISGSTMPRRRNANWSRRARSIISALAFFVVPVLSRTRFPRWFTYEIQ